MNLHKFNEINEKFNEKLQVAEINKQELTTEFYKAQTHYKEMQYLCVEENSSGNKQKQTKAYKALNDVRQQVKEADEHIELVKEVKNNKLKDAFPKVEAELKASHEQAKQDVEAELDSLKKLRCDIVLKALELKDKFTEVNAKSNEIHSLAREIGIDFKFNGDLPSINLHNNYGGNDKAYAPSQQEVIEAYHRGTVAPFIRYYGETGNLVSDADASTYFRNKNKKDVK